MMDAKARQDCIKEIELLKVNDLPVKQSKPISQPLIPISHSIKLLIFYFLLAIEPS